MTIGRSALPAAVADVGEPCQELVCQHARMDTTGSAAEMSSRLTSVAPDIVAALTHQSTPTLQIVARTAADWIVDRTGLRDPRADAGLAALRQRNFGPSTERSELVFLVKQLDERAWDIQDRQTTGTATDADYLTAFGLARAASAIWYALDGSALQAAMESVYEAQAASGELETLRALVYAVLP